MDDKVHYPLKRLNELFEQDAPAFSMTIEYRHSVLDGMRLHEGVPVEVRQQFETAKNIALYSHFAYRLQQPAEMVAYSAFEWALRARAIVDHPELFKKRSRHGLWEYAQLALKHGWLSDEKFPSRRHRAERYARQLKNIEATRIMDMRGLDVMEVELPSEEEIDEVMSRIRIAETLLSTVHHRRNDLAHGSATLMPSAHGTLQIICEAINQIFSDPLHE